MPTSHYIRVQPPRGEPYLFKTSEPRLKAGRSAQNDLVLKDSDIEEREINFSQWAHGQPQPIDGNYTLTRVPAPTPHARVRAARDEPSDDAGWRRLTLPRHRPSTPPGRLASQRLRGPLWLATIVAVAAALLIAAFSSRGELLEVKPQSRLITTLRLPTPAASPALNSVAALTVAPTLAPLLTVAPTLPPRTPGLVDGPETPTPVPETATPTGLPTATLTPTATLSPVAVIDLEPPLTALGVWVEPARVPVGEAYWRLTQARWLDEEEADSKNYIFVQVLDQAGERVLEQPLTVSWLDDSVTKLTNKSGQQSYAADFLMNASGNAYSVQMEELPSDVAHGLGMGTVAQPLAYTRTSFHLTFQRTIRE